MAPPAFSRSSDEEELELQKAKKKKQSEKAPLVKKVSLEDRMADILKRHGSSMAESFAKPVEVVIPLDVPSHKADKEAESKNDAASEHAQSSSSSDSLGMESADFEVLYLIKYVQNQRFIDDQDELVKQLQHSNEQLKEQLHHLTTTNKAKSHRPSSSTTDKRRIQALEAQLKDMHVAMQKRHPDSLVNLILASKPDDVVAQLELQIQQLHDQRLEIEAQHEVKLTRFRQQHERVVQQLRQQLENRPNMDDESTESVATVRRFYLAKIKDCRKYADVAAQVPILEAAVQSLESRLSVPNTPSMLQYHALEMQIHTLTQKHAIRETELHVLLQNATQSSKMEVMQLQQRHEQAMAVKRAEIASFQAQLDEMLAELKRLHHQHP
ncbi:hypothetical protein DYB28_000460 [Aphanomyces astaci]|uniref:Centrosomal protein of 162 kDa n=2 Tax=Aphanomyces astaci TaxID=112090 RepID=A0A9X8DV98_APHAT|nr:hypothetical protein DYB28_000460 [Aphanomyces astaci]